MPVMRGVSLEVDPLFRKIQLPFIVMNTRDISIRSFGYLRYKYQMRRVGERHGVVSK